MSIFYSKKKVQSNNSSKVVIDFGDFKKNLHKYIGGPGLYFIECSENQKIYFGQ
jgi:hypothetical protein